MLQLTAESTLTKQQYKSFGPRPVEGYGPGAAIWAHVRFDDECGNGHNSFSITGSVRVPKQRDIAAGGCIHEEISASFPELSPLIKWHLCSTDGPLHYVANTAYHASNRDHYGKLAGEPSRWNHAVQFGENPIKHKLKASFAKFLQANRAGVGGLFDFEVIRYDHENRQGETYKFAPKFTFGGYAEKWHECPFDTENEALDFLAALQMHNPRFVEIPTEWSEGKERDLDAARHCAIWPDATDDDLIAPGLKERLEERLPALLVEFRQAVESLGFVW